MTDKLTVKQNAFISTYTNPNSDAFGNGTQSYKQAYNVKSDNVAGVNAHNVLKNPKIRHRIDKILDTLGYGEQVRMSTLSDIGKGLYIKKTVQTRTDADGTVKDVIVTESTPGADSIVRVNDMINKLTGKYETAKQGARILSKSMQRLVDSVTSQAMQQPSKRKQKTVTPIIEDKQTE
ncbi:MAG: terminase small subunit [Proteobacteria bacterium]|nr:terminase small subunit [Pseudomonadota bacterium]